MKKTNVKALLALILSIMLIAAATTGCAPTPAQETASTQPAASSQAPASQAPSTQAPSQAPSSEAPAQSSQAAATGDSDYYKGLPFQDVLPLDAGDIKINGEVKPIVIGFSQTGFNHPWRVEMINAAKAEIERHPNVKMVTTDGNVDIVKTEQRYPGPDQPGR